MHKEAVVTADFSDTLRTLVISGRPLRVRMNEYIQGWEDQPQKIKELTDQGIVPMSQDMDDGKDVDIPFLMGGSFQTMLLWVTCTDSLAGQVAGVIGSIEPARKIVEDMVKEAVDMLQLGQSYVSVSSKL